MFKIFCTAALFALVTLTNNAHAEIYSLEEANNKFIEQKLSIPQAEDDGRIQTLNKKGAIIPFLDESTTEFVKDAKGKKVLEIGGGYGKVMIETLLKNSSVTYDINDLDERHLFIAANILNSSKIKQSIKEKVKFISGDISKKLNISYKYDAILIARVLHFFSPIQLDSAIQNIYDLLTPGGKVYIVAITPYVKRYESFIPIYEHRLKENTQFPGYVENLRDWVNKDSTSLDQLNAIDNVHFMFLDVSVLTNLFAKHNFKIIKCQTTGLGFTSASWSLDGRENVILIAQKL